ncbi:MAG: hypothetical protein R3B95_19610 [Nitrospirales bacterium]|nr:hypothetical protein [Nitrospirales bacterium]
MRLTNPTTFTKEREMELLTPQQVARNIFTTIGTLAKWRLKGIGPRFIKLGPRSIAYPKAELQSWLESNLRQSTSGGGKGGRKKQSEQKEVTER